MDPIEFRNYIESIGFKNDGYGLYYRYNQYEIILYFNSYDFINGSEWIRNIDLNDLRPLKKITRSIKLKQILK